MIKFLDQTLYGTKIAKAILVLREEDAEGMGYIEDERCELEGEKAILLYDRAHRGKSWFVLDLRT